MLSADPDWLLCWFSAHVCRTQTESFPPWSIGCLLRPTAKRLFYLTFCQMPSSAQITQQAELFVDPSRWAVRVGLFFLGDKSFRASALSAGSMFAQVASHMFCMEAFTSLKQSRKKIEWRLGQIPAAVLWVKNVNVDSIAAERIFTWASPAAFAVRTINVMAAQTVIW